MPEHVIDILYEDGQYIVFDKPAGLLVIPTPKNEQKTLSNIVNRQYASKEKLYKLEISDQAAPAVEKH